MKTMIPSPRLRGLITTAVFGALASAFSAVGVAAAGADAPTLIVKYGDLDVSTAQGATALYGRIRSAAKTVCPPFDQRDLAWRVLRATCINDAIARAVTEVNQPALFMVYKANNRTPVPKTLLSQSR
ncbi:MAG: hypothetical protein JWO52_7140 [Gammaproteobacteria bacterium]|jgi:UrcA family protein|nr:hypothetical protein [Gammaproteobacteria bacterium]